MKKRYCDVCKNVVKKHEFVRFEKLREIKIWRLLSNLDDLLCLLGDLELAEVLVALFLGLEAAVAELGCCIDPLKIDFFCCDSL